MKNILLVSFAVLALGSVSCDRSNQGVAFNLKAAAKFLEGYTNLAASLYSETNQALDQFSLELAAFEQKPTQLGLNRLKLLWTKARGAYSQTEVFRFYDSPIEAVESQINAWPLDEEYIDSTLDPKRKGIIQNRKKYPVLSQSLLLELNEKEGERSITSGFHAIEYLLWGVDHSKTGPGNRPLSHFTTSVFAKRRIEYLMSASNLMLEQLRKVHEQWTPGGVYRVRFLSTPKDSVRKVFIGLIALSGEELSGERMGVAFETGDQEEEQSCFSDTTLDDHLANLKGIERVIRGTKKSPGLLGLMSETQQKVLLTRLENSKFQMNRIPKPFDQAILKSAPKSHRLSIEKTIESLMELSRELSTIGSDLGIELNPAKEKIS